MQTIKLKKKYRTYGEKPAKRKGAADNGRNSPHKKQAGVQKGAFGVGYAQAPKWQFTDKVRSDPDSMAHARVVDGATGRMRRVS